MLSQRNLKQISKGFFIHSLRFYIKSNVLLNMKLYLEKNRRTDVQTDFLNSFKKATLIQNLYKTYCKITE